MDTNGRVLFNEKCGICNFEIKHYKKRSALDFNNCSDMEDKYLKKLHVVFDDGRELIGVDAFIYIWERTTEKLPYGCIKFVFVPTTAPIGQSSLLYLPCYCVNLLRPFGRGLRIF